MPEGNDVVGHPKVESRTADEVTIRVPLEIAEANVIAFTVSSFRRTKMQTMNIASDSILRPNEKRSPSASRRRIRRSAQNFFSSDFIGGFILNLMPCVLPVISLKIFGFIQQAGQRSAKILRSGLAFVAGIFVWFIGAGACSHRVEGGRAPDHVGGAIHQSLFRPRPERGCARVRAESFRRF